LADFLPAKYLLRLTHERQRADIQFLVFSFFLQPEAGRIRQIEPTGLTVSAAD